MSGTTGQALRLEAIQIRLTGEMAEHYDVYYRVHAQNLGWLGWAKNDTMAGTAGYSYRLEGIEIKLVEKGDAAPGNTEKAFYEKGIGYFDGDPEKFHLSYNTHVQNIGWQGYVSDGDTAGTTGQSLRLEGIKIKLVNAPYSGGIEYCTHVQNIGWQDYVSNDELGGTTGQAHRLEAIRIRLTGEMAEYYDVYYRAHAQNYGWLGWAKNGEDSGTTGFSYRLEAIEIIIEKGGIVQGDTSRSFVEHAIGIKECDQAGSLTLNQWFGNHRDDFVKWLSSHQYDNYYLGTPYPSSYMRAVSGSEDFYSPNGDPTASGMAVHFSGTPAMQCTGFVFHALYKAGVSTSEIPRVYSSRAYVYPKGRKTWSYFIYNEGIRHYFFNSKSQLLNSGLCEKGDIIFINQSEDPHVLIFWGDSSNEDKAWHSNIYDMKNVIAGIYGGEGDILGYYLLKWENIGTLDVRINEEIANVSFDIFTDENCLNKKGTVTTDSSGLSNAIKLGEGTYYVKMSNAPDENVYQVSVRYKENTRLDVNFN